MVSKREIDRLRQAAQEKLVGNLPPDVVIPKGGIVEFAKVFLGVDLFPVQALILKLATLAIDLFTPYDYGILEEWMSGFTLDDSDDPKYRGRKGTTPDLLERLRWCIDHGRTSPRECVFVIGRRGSKSFLAALLAVWRVWNLLALGDPQRHYQMPPGKTLFIHLFAADKETLKRTGYADVVGFIRNAECFKPFLGVSTSEMVSLLTPAQLADGARPGVDLGSIQIVAAATTTTAARGPTVFHFWFNEFGHLRGQGTTAGSVDLYGSSMPAMSQFEIDGMAIQTSTPMGQTGQLYKSYLQTLAVDPLTGWAKDPGIVMVQLPSDEPYRDAHRAQDIEMWPGGPNFAAGLQPKITRQYIEERRIWDPHGVEREYEAQFASAANAYLLVPRIDSMFGLYKGVRLTHLDRGKLGTRYVAHVDLSKSGANTAVVIEHLEFDNDRLPNVVVDLIKVWRPEDFPDGVIDYIYVVKELLKLLKAFRIAVMTFDHYNSIMPIQSLIARAEADGVDWRPDIHERTPTRALNWKTAEILKKAVHLELVHAPPHDLARAELVNLRVENEKVFAPTGGDVETKDTFDCLAGATYTLLYEHLDMFDKLGALQLRGTLPGGLPQNRPGSDSSMAAQFTAAGRTATAQRADTYHNPARGLKRR